MNQINAMVIDYRLVLVALGSLCALTGLILLLRQLLHRRPYTGRAVATLTGYEETYETTKEGTQTISQRVFYPVFQYRFNEKVYEKTTAHQLFEADQRPTDVTVNIMINPDHPEDCLIYYQEYPLLTPILTICVGAAAALVGLILLF